MLQYVYNTGSNTLCFTVRLKIHQHCKECAGGIPWTFTETVMNSLPWFKTEGKRSCCMTRLTTNNRDDRTLRNRKQVVVLKCQNLVYTIVMCHRLKWRPSKTDPQRWLTPDSATEASQQEYYFTFAIRRNQG